VALRRGFGVGDYVDIEMIPPHSATEVDRGVCYGIESPRRMALEPQLDTFDLRLCHRSRPGADMGEGSQYRRVKLVFDYWFLDSPSHGHDHDVAAQH